MSLPPSTSVPERRASVQGVTSAEDYEHNSWKRQSEGSNLALAKLAKAPHKTMRSHRVVLLFNYHRQNLTIQSSFLTELTVTQAFLDGWKKKHRDNYDLEDLRKHWISLVPKYKWFQPKDGCYNDTYLMYFKTTDPNRADRPYIILNGLQKMYEGGFVDPVRSAENEETVFVVLCGSIEVKIEGNPQSFKAKCLEEIHIPRDTGYSMINTSDTCNTVLAVALIKCMDEESLQDTDQLE